MNIAHSLTSEVLTQTHYYKTSVILMLLALHSEYKLLTHNYLKETKSF